MEEDASPAASTPKGKKGKKGGKGTAADEDDGMDEVDRALAAIKLKYGDAPRAESGSEVGPSQPSESRSVMNFRGLLSVEPKNLDADAELRRFFGSKVVSLTL